MTGDMLLVAGHDTAARRTLDGLSAMSLQFAGRYTRRRTPSLPQAKCLQLFSCIRMALTKQTVSKLGEFPVCTVSLWSCPSRCAPYQAEVHSPSCRTQPCSTGVCADCGAARHHILDGGCRSSDLAIGLLHTAHMECHELKSPQLMTLHVRSVHAWSLGTS